MTTLRKNLPRVETSSPDLVQENIAQLKELFPEAVTENKVDFSKLRLLLGDEVDDRPERYTFSWAGKRDAIRLLQTPSRATLTPAPEESVDFENTGNLFIEGDNLEVLKLLYKSYAGRVKMIYIDPPYNTGNDFIYHDNFADPLARYLQVTGQADEVGNLLTSNPETSGRYHSAWLSMMYPRLFIARQFLRNDGLIFVSIDDHEVHNLRMLLNELFGEENFVAQLIWKGRQFPDSRALTRVSTDHEYVLIYTRNGDIALRGTERDESKFANPDDDPRGPWMSRSILGLATKEQRPNLHYEITDPATGNSFSPPASSGWRYSTERMKELIGSGCILFPSSAHGRPREKKYRSDLANEYTSFPSIVSDVYTAQGTAEIRELFGFQAFDFPKPSELIRRLVQQGCGPDDVVLDFFAGSATTAHAVYLQNRADGGRRKCISVQLPEPTASESEVNRHGFATIAEIAKERLRRVGKKIASEDSEALPFGGSDAHEDLGFAVFKLAESNFRRWQGTEILEADDLALQMEMFNDPLVPGWQPTNVAYEILLKAGYSLASRIETIEKKGAGAALFRVVDQERDQKLILCLDNHIDDQMIRSLELTKDDLFVCRDVALSDELAANLALQCRLRTI
ncbi:MAG: site-specific DNA-methyltransferase [Desulfomonilaceae bacterium]